MIEETRITLSEEPLRTIFGIRGRYVDECIAVSAMCGVSAYQSCKSS